jgi:arabinan endo-1,5-alpha-L-arabinosidase
MLQGGGTLFLERRDRFIGPGHVGIFSEAGADWCSYHFYDGNQAGRPALMIERLSWDAEHWPVIKRAGERKNAPY